jgi:hypothetical protein
MSFFVCFLYAFKVAVKSASKLVEDVELEGACDIMLVVEGLGLDAQPPKIRSIVRGRS